jgi:hypothetical protein
MKCAGLHAACGNAPLFYEKTLTGTPARSFFSPVKTTGTMHTFFFPGGH